MIIKGMGLVNGKGSDVVGSEVKQSEGEEELCKEDAFKFRSLAARCNFLSMDRPDLQYACKEICRRMSSPRTGDWMLLKKLARYLVKHRRVAIDFRFQNDANFVDGYSDSDYAGCKDTRKSTSGGCMMIGTHTIRSWSSTQAVVAMSSGEAEFYAVVRCVCELLGLHGLPSRPRNANAYPVFHRLIGSARRGHAQGGRKDQASRNEDTVGARSSRQGNRQDQQDQRVHQSSLSHDEVH